MKTILVTGTNKGIGLEFARQYLNEGFKVIATSVSYTHLRAHETREDRGWGGGGG